jgi:hypothetical protein
MRRIVLALLLVIAGCGAKTGLLIRHYDGGPDAPVDAFMPPDAGLDAPLSCIPGHYTLVRGTAEVMFVIDRSGSMAFNLDGSMLPPRRWDVLQGALTATLPPYQSTLAMGAYAYPRRFDGSVARSCDITRAIDVESALDNATGVLTILTETDPWGATPTAASIELVGAALLPRQSLDHSATIVLSTDGGPNCNPALDVRMCQCTGRDPMGMTSCFGMPTNCLDDLRARDNIAALAAQGIPTFVIGLDADAEDPERMALEEMALAGGRPNTSPGQPAYYSARRPDQVAAAFDTIERSIVRCTLRSPSRPDDPDAIAITLEGAAIARDRSHLDGWDWSDMDFARITFFGAACDRVASSTDDPEVTVGCSP